MLLYIRVKPVWDLNENNFVRLYISDYSLTAPNFYLSDEYQTQFYHVSLKTVSSHTILTILICYCLK